MFVWNCDNLIENKLKQIMKINSKSNKKSKKIQSKETKLEDGIFKKKLFGIVIKIHPSGSTLKLHDSTIYLAQV